MLVCNANGSGPSRGSNFSLATFLSENVVQHLYVFLLPSTFSTSYPEEIYGMIDSLFIRIAAPLAFFDLLVAVYTSGLELRKK